MLASEFAAPVPARRAGRGHVAQSAPRNRAVRDQELRAEVRDRRGEEQVLPGLALPRRRARRQSRPRHLGHRPERLGRAPPRADRQGRLDELLPGSGQAAARHRAEVPEPPPLLHAGEPHVLLHEHAGAALHEPQGAAGRELRDLAPVARAPRDRAGPHVGEHPAAGLSVVPGARPLPAQPAQGDPPRARVRLLALAEEGLRLEPRRPRRPAVHGVPRRRC